MISKGRSFPGRDDPAVVVPDSRRMAARASRETRKPLGRRKRRFSLRRKKVSWAEGSASALPFLMGRDDPAAVVPDSRRMAARADRGTESPWGGGREDSAPGGRRQSGRGAAAQPYLCNAYALATSRSYRSEWKYSARIARLFSFSSLSRTQRNTSVF
jgi:hypothetical protein